MNHTFNNTQTPQTNPWKESGAMIYVAFTVATFSALTMCCVWFFKKKWLRPSNYTSLNESEDVELVAPDSSSSEEEISLDDEYARPESSKFTLEDSDEDDDSNNEKQPDEQPDAV
jgi:hypothetical protein